MATIRVSFCRNAGAQRGKIVGTAVLKTDTANLTKGKNNKKTAHYRNKGHNESPSQRQEHDHAGETNKDNQLLLMEQLEQLARNKLRIPKRKRVILFEHRRGTRITANNLRDVVQNGTILNVSNGEDFVSLQGESIQDEDIGGSPGSSLANSIPKPPRWPAFAELNQQKTAGARQMPDEDEIPQHHHESTMTLTIYLDLDGVLADFDQGIQRICQGKHPSQVPRRQMWEAIASDPDFFGTLPWTSHGPRLFDTLTEAFGREHIEILTACGNRRKHEGVPESDEPSQDSYAEQKRQWCHLHLGSDIRVHTCSQSNQKPRWVVRQDDDRTVNKNSRERSLTRNLKNISILVDDNLDIQRPWEARGGIFIHYMDDVDSASQSITDRLSKLTNEYGSAIDRLCAEITRPEGSTHLHGKDTRDVPFYEMAFIELNTDSVLELLQLEVPSLLDDWTGSGRISQFLSRPAHVTMAHFRQVQQKMLRSSFEKLVGESVQVFASQLLWNDEIAAIEVKVSSLTDNDKAVPDPLKKEFPHITLWHNAKTTKPVEANLLPQLVLQGQAKQAKFSQFHALLGVVKLKTGGDDDGGKSKSATKATMSLEVRLPFVASRVKKSPFADLSGNVFKRFKRLAQTNPHIVLRHHDNHISVDYSDLAAFTDRSATSIDDLAYLEECRGLLLSTTDGSVLARRFHKFYNIHENARAVPSDIRGALLLEKLDGFLVSPFLVPSVSTCDEDDDDRTLVQWASRQQRSPEMESLVSKLEGETSIPYNEFSRQCLQQGYTPIFECLSGTLHNGIVTYDTPRLVLLAIRHMTSGVYLTRSEMEEASSELQIPLPRIIRRVHDESYETLESLLDFVRNDLNTVKGEEMEGVVLVHPDGQRRFKIKTAWYVNSTRARGHAKQSTSSGTLGPSLFRRDDSLNLTQCSAIPTMLLWELALWEWLTPLSETASQNQDDWLPIALDKLCKEVQCPVDVLLYFMDSIRSNVTDLDRSFIVWSGRDEVKNHPRQAEQIAERAGWSTQVIQAYIRKFPNSTNAESKNAQHVLVKFLWDRLVKKSEWSVLKSVLRQSFVSLSDLYTDHDHFLEKLLLPSLLSSPKLEPLVIILRGLPCSGKSYFVNRILLPFLEERCDIKDTDVTICSADDYFVNQRGEYKFDASQLQDAHSQCRERFVDSITKSKKVTIVDNTNSTLQEYQFYKRKCTACYGGCRLLILEVHGTGNVSQLREKSTHQVPSFVVEQQRRRWEDDPEAIHIQNFHPAYKQ